LCLIPESVCKDGYCPPIYKSYIAFANNDNPNAVGEQLLYMAVDTIIYFGLIMLVEYDVFKKLHDVLMRMVIGNEIEVQELESDVLMEKERVCSNIAGTVIFIFQELFHLYVASVSIAISTHPTLFCLSTITYFFTYLALYCVVPNILWHIHLLLGNDHYAGNYTTSHWWVITL
jgi:hypothetical protein